MASIHHGPAVDFVNSRYSASSLPVSGLTAVAVRPGFNLALCLGSRFGTPRAGAGSPFAGGNFDMGMGVGTSCWLIVLKKCMSWPWWVSSMVLTRVSIGGSFSIAMASSMVALSRSRLSNQGNGQVGNHITWLTTLVCRDCIAHTV